MIVDFEGTRVEIEDTGPDSIRIGLITVFCEECHEYHGVVPRLEEHIRNGLRSDIRFWREVVRANKAVADDAA